jgi:hypothetical protein
MAPPDFDPPRASGPAQETGKQRATRIPLNYFKKANGLERWKLWLSLGALVLSVGWVVSAVVTPGGNQRFSRGHVAQVHAAWDQQCSACHVDFAPMTQQNLFMSKPSASDARCETCHKGTVHHDSQLTSATPSCAGCHRDHQGRDFSLVRLADSDCTSCHRDLGTHVTAGKKTEWAPKITAFATDHPEFRLPKTDPGNVKFNHKVHVTAGLGAQYTLEKIRDKSERERYARQQGATDDGQLVRLDCASCHRLDSRDFGIKGDKLEGLPSAVLPNRAAGAFMLPITYENQCKACHPTTFDPKIKQAAPHRVQPAELTEFLRQVYARQYLLDNPTFDRKVPLDTPPLPGKRPADPQEVVEARTAIETSVRSARLLLLGAEDPDKKEAFLQGKQSCTECHGYVGEGKTRRVLPSAIPDIWQAHARFNHVSHRAMDCRACHANAYAFQDDNKTPNPTASVKKDDVLIPNVANCRQCHAPARTENGEPRGGVRHNCTDCHNYHHGDKPLQGPGAAARDPDRKMTWPQLLKGSRN